jgi:hypothetical protein
MSQQSQYPYAQNQPQGPPFDGPVPPPPGGQPVKPPKKPMTRGARIGWSILIGACIFVVGVLVGNGGSTASTANAPAKTAVAVGNVAPTATVTVTETVRPSAPDETTEPPAPTYGVPTKADFKLTLKQLTKQCFGSAGCNVSYRVLVKYSGPALDPEATYDVLYRVAGGEDGPVDNRLTVNDGQSSVDEEEMVSTSSSKTKLTVTVTDVLAG